MARQTVAVHLGTLNSIGVPLVFTVLHSTPECHRGKPATPSSSVVQDTHSTFSTVQYIWNHYDTLGYTQHYCSTPDTHSSAWYTPCTARIMSDGHWLLWPGRPSTSFNVRRLRRRNDRRLLGRLPVAGELLLDRKRKWIRRHVVVDVGVVGRRVAQLLDANIIDLPSRVNLRWRLVHGYTVVKLSQGLRGELTWSREKFRSQPLDTYPVDATVL